MKKAFFTFVLAVFTFVLLVLTWSVLSGSLPSWLPVEQLRVLLGGRASDTFPIPITQIPVTNSSATSFVADVPDVLNAQQNHAPVSFSERLALGRAMLAVHNYPQAVTEFSAAIKLDSRSVDALLGLAEAQINSNHLDQANANLVAVDKLDATHPRLALLRGEIAMQKNDYTQANEFFTRAGALGGFHRALLASFFDRTDEAKTLLADAVQGADAPLVAKAKILLEAYTEYFAYPDSPKTHLATLLARSYNRLGEYTLAVNKLRSVLATDPTYRDAWLLIGYAYYARTEYELARSAWGTAYSLDSAKPETQYFLGLVYAALGNYPNAEKYLLLAKTNGFTPLNELTKKLAEVYYAEEKFQPAAELYYQRVQDPDAKIEEFVRGVYLFLEKVEDGNKAWSIASRALQKFPNDPQAYNLVGWVSVKNGYLAEAKKYLTHALTLDPNLSGAYLNLGIYYEKSINLDSAKLAYKKAYELDTLGTIGLLAEEAFIRISR